jgi:predicted nuclease of restriction endonuclease-like (RecB) superfamily
MKIVDPEFNLFDELVVLIESSKKRVNRTVNGELNLLFWHIGKRINEEILQNNRAEYGKKVVPKIAEKLTAKYGRNFEVRNLRRMMQFANVIKEYEIVEPLARQLTWSHILLLIPLREVSAQLFYANRAIEENWSKRELRKQIELKAFERTEIANFQLKSESNDLFNTFKDPYVLDFLNLKNSFIENDLESAILKDLESFILELGKGFAFMERQKRIIIDGEDFYLDLLFYNRNLKRLVAIELKMGKFQAQFKGQMELYLKWLNRYEKAEDEKEPIGLILCAESNKEQIELLEMHKDGIMVAEYWTVMPPKKELEQKLHFLLREAKDRLVTNG